MDLLTNIASLNFQSALNNLEWVSAWCLWREMSIRNVLDYTKRNIRRSDRTLSGFKLYLVTTPSISIVRDATIKSIWKTISEAGIRHSFVRVPNTASQLPSCQNFPHGYSKGIHITLFIVCGTCKRRFSQSALI